MSINYRGEEVPVVDIYKLQCASYYGQTVVALNSTRRVYKATFELWKTREGIVATLEKINNFDW